MTACASGNDADSELSVAEVQFDTVAESVAYSHVGARSWGAPPRRPPPSPQPPPPFPPLADSVAAQEDEADLGEQGCALEESVWDASLLVLTTLHGHASSAWAVMLLLVNMLMQWTFVYIVLIDLAKQDINKDTVLGFRAWRTNIAHLPYV